MLTVLGDSFPSRVCASLYESFASLHHSDVDLRTDSVGSPSDLSGVMVAQSLRDFEDVAVRLLTGSRRVLRATRGILAAAIREKRGLFDAERSVMNFVRGMQSLRTAAQFSAEAAGSGKRRAGSHYHVAVLR